MKDYFRGMGTLLLITLLAIILVILGLWIESGKGPYDIGTHWDYSIECNNGFKYKILGNKRGVIQLLNSDGSPMRCDK
jgi:hypothetical protein